MTYSTDPDRRELHDRALTLARDQGISYLDAAMALSEPEAVTSALATDPVTEGIHKLIGRIAEGRGKTYGDVLDWLINGGSVDELS